MKIHIRTPNNHIYDISVNSNCTVKTIKDKIQEVEGIPHDQQRLIFDGNILEDEHFISDYNITENDIIILILRLRGGMVINNPIEEEKSKREEERKIFNFKFDSGNEVYYLKIYDGNLTIKDLLNNFLSKINSKDKPETLNFLYRGYLLNVKFSKKIQEIFYRKEPIITIKVSEANQVMGGN